MKPKLFTFIVLSILFQCIDAVASDSNQPNCNLNYLVIEHLDGNVFDYSFDENPKLSFSYDELCITSGHYSVTYPYNSLRRYYFKEGEQSSIEVPKTKMSISFKGDCLHISLEKSNEIIYIYSSIGAIIHSALTDSNGEVLINFQDFDSGLYIIKCLDISTKIYKK